MELDARTILLILPEIILASVAVLVMVGGAFVRSNTGWFSLSVAAILAAGVFLYRQANPEFADAAAIASGPLAIDALARTLRWVSLGFGLLFTLMMARRAGIDGDGELLGMLLLMVAGVMLVTSAADLITMFLALEMVTIPTYVLLFLGRSGPRSAEATAKYFYLSILSSGFLLMGFVLVFGLTGSMNLTEIGQAMNALITDEAPLRQSLIRPALLAMVLIVAALGFKIAAVPFHFYAPDVYLATSNLNAGLLAVVPKIAGLLAMARLTPLLVPLFPEFGWQLMIILSILTMTIGNVCALLQKNIRRMMAYSSIAHAGYMLIGVAVGLFSGDETIVYGGFAAAFLHLFVYGLASIGTFAALTEVEDDETTSGSVASLAGLARRRPWMAGVIGVCMFSLAGLPPLAGFWGKLTLFSSALTAYRGSASGFMFLVLVIVAAVNAAIAATYYLRIVGAMYFERGPTEETSAASVGAVAAVACGLIVVLAGLFPGRMVDHFQRLGPSQPGVRSASAQAGSAQSDDRFTLLELSDRRVSHQQVLSLERICFACGGFSPVSPGIHDAMDARRLSDTD